LAIKGNSPTSDTCFFGIQSEFITTLFEHFETPIGEFSPLALGYRLQKLEPIKLGVGTLLASRVAKTSENKG
jgi:hypothetical protein